MSDTPDPIQQLRERFETFHERVRLTNITREVSDLENRIKTLPADIQKVRTRGYAFRSYLEHKADVLQQHWQDIQKRVHKTIADETDALRDDADRIERRIRRLSAEPDEAAASTLPPMLDNLEKKLEAVENQIRNLYQTLRNDVQSTFNQLYEINWCLDQKDEASFSFLAGEALFLAARAEWVATGKDKQDPDGILFLTDQRLVFEQKETTGKKLGLFGGKKEQEVEWEIPLHAITSIRAENQGLFGGKDMLYLETTAGNHRQLVIEVKGGVDCKFWQKQIQRMISGDVSNERAIEPDAELLEQVRKMPTACHVCGGTLPMLVAGQNQVTCPYCGAVVRV
jgi:archaellum component FlaC